MEIAPIKGTHDVYGDEAAGYEYITSVLKATAQLYGYQEFITPILEYTELFSRSTGEGSDIVRKEMYTFLDKGDRSVTLRPEFTASIVRSIVSNKLYATSDLPIKAYYAGPAFRYERPQFGRYRQFNQFGVESVGQDSARADAECILLAIQSLSMLGFKNLKLKINSIGDDETRTRYSTALKEYFAAHLDAMCEDCHERIKINPMRILDCKVPEDQEIVKGAPKIKDFLSEASEKRFYQTLSIINDLGVTDYEIDDGLVRGLDYYSEVVFEIAYQSPSGQEYGALGGGGHYGGLVKQLGGPDLPGVGFAFGIERLYGAMSEQKLLEEIVTGLDVYVMPIGEGVLDDAFEITESIRLEGFSAETPLEPLKLGAMFKKAERRKARFALIIGQDELDKGIAQLKDLATKTQREIKLGDLQKELDKAFGEDEHEHHHSEE